MKNIIHVDDDDSFLWMVKEIINNLDFTGAIHSYENPEEALELMKEHDTEWDLLITDYDMPQMNGVTLAREAKKFSDAPIILFSGSKIIFDEVCKELFDFSIPKFNTPGLYTKLKELLN